MEKYLKPFMLLQGALAAAIAWLSNKLGILFPMLVILCFLMAADYITGMLASKKEALDHPDNPAYGWCSAKGARGILKKVGYMAVIAVAMTLDYVIMIMAGQVGLDVRKSVFFGLWQRHGTYLTRCYQSRKMRAEWALTCRNGC